VILSGPLPRTPTGKVRRRQLAAELQQMVKNA
jgi:acyl-coenzyme A synthetase/AMP-(fatty) acid ligase